MGQFFWASLCLMGQLFNVLLYIFLLLKQDVCEALWNIFILVALYKSNLLLIEEIR